MSLGFCGTPIRPNSNIVKRNISNVCGVLWDSNYTKKKHLQCLWGSVVVLIIIFSMSVGWLMFLFTILESHRTPQTLQMVLFSIYGVPQNPTDVANVSFQYIWSTTEPHRHCKSFLLVHMESHRHPTDIEKLLIRLPQIPQTLQMILFSILSPTDIPQTLKNYY